MYRQTGDLVKVLIQQPLELEEILDTLDRRRASPVGEGSLSRLHRFVHLVRGRERYAHHRLGSRGVAHIEKLAGTRALPFPSDIVEQLSILYHGVTSLEPILQMNKITRTPVGADLSRPQPIDRPWVDGPLSE